MPNPSPVKSSQIVDATTSATDEGIVLNALSDSGKKYETTSSSESDVIVLSFTINSVDTPKISNVALTINGATSVTYVFKNADGVTVRTIADQSPVDGALNTPLTDIVNAKTLTILITPTGSNVEVLLSDLAITACFSPVSGNRVLYLQMTFLYCIANFFSISFTD